MGERFPKSGRRAFLSIAGSVGLATVSTPALATNTSAGLPESTKGKLREKYGSESRQIINVLEPLYVKWQKGKLSREEYHTTATLAFLRESDTPQLRSEILETWRTMPISLKKEIR